MVKMPGVAPEAIADTHARGWRMESWRSRKTLILSRTDMMGLVTPAEYVSCVEQAYRMHGEGRYYMDPKGHIVLDKYPGEWEAMPSYIEEPGSRRMQMGVDPRAQPRKVRSADGVFDPDLHSPGNRLSARDLRRLLPHRHAHRRVRRGLGKMAGAQEFQTAGDCRRRSHGRRNAGDLRHGV